MLKEIKLYPKYVSMSLRSTLSYKAEAIISIIGFLITNLALLASTYLMLETIPEFGDWSFSRIAVLYGFMLIPKSVDHVLTDDIWLLGWRGVRRGELDVYLTRPLNPLFQYVAKTFKWDGLGELIVGIALICIFVPTANIAWNASTIIALIICSMLATFCFFDIKLLFSSLAFWTTNAGMIATIIYNMSDYAKYPLKYMGAALRYIMFFVIPFGLFLYYPFELLYSGGNVWIAVGASALAALILTTIAFTVYHFGIKRYDSTGT